MSSKANANPANERKTELIDGDTLSDSSSITTEKKKKKPLYKRNPSKKLKKMGKSMKKSVRKSFHHGSSSATVSTKEEEETKKSEEVKLSPMMESIIETKEHEDEQHAEKKKRKPSVKKIGKSFRKSFRSSGASSAATDSSNTDGKATISKEDENETKKKDAASPKKEKQEKNSVTSSAKQKEEGKIEEHGDSSSLNAAPNAKSKQNVEKLKNTKAEDLSPPPSEVPAMLTSALAAGNGTIEPKRTTSAITPTKAPPITNTQSTTDNIRRTSSTPIKKSTNSSSKTQYDYLFKIVLIGDSNVGKTSLLQQYADSSFPTSHVTTIGVDFRTNTLILQNKQVAKLQIWDTAGQERFRSVTTNYYRGAEGIIIMYDVTSVDSFENVRHWLEDIHKQMTAGVSSNTTPKPNILLVGNKIDLRDKRVIKTEQGRQLARELSDENSGTIRFVETSAKTDSHVDECFHGMAEEMRRVREDMEQNGAKSSGAGGGKSVSGGGGTKLTSTETSYMNCC